MTEHEHPTPNRRRRGVLTGALVGLVLAGGGFSIAAAAQDAPTPSAQHQEPGEGHDATFTSSIKAKEAPETKDGNDAAEAASEKAQSAALAKLATVTPAQAVDAATKAVPGKASMPELSNEDGNVVYKVTVSSADGKTTTDVVIDAGNATVLAQEVDNGHDANEAPEQGEQPAVPATAPDTTGSALAPTTGSAPATTPGVAPGN